MPNATFANHQLNKLKSQLKKVVKSNIRTTNVTEELNILKNQIENLTTEKNNMKEELDKLKELLQNLSEK